jgi:hypothetical protein
MGWERNIIQPYSEKKALSAIQMSPEPLSLRAECLRPPQSAGQRSPYLKTTKPQNFHHILRLIREEEENPHLQAIVSLIK